MSTWEGFNSTEASPDLCVNQKSETAMERSESGPGRYGVIF